MKHRTILLKLPSKKLRHKATTEDYSELIRSDHTIHIPEYGRILYKKINYDSRELIYYLSKVKFGYRERTGGLKTRTESIGNKPRNPRKLDVCDIAVLAVHHPEAHELLLEVARILTHIFEEYMPEDFRMHRKILDAEEILPEYIIPETPFSSGVVNKNDAIGYHFDDGNVEGMLSCMIVFKNDITGGYLSVPQLDIAFETDDCTVLIFDGKGLLHGVTPIKYENQDGYRYSVVFYVREGMWKCLPADDELDSIRELREFKEQLNNENEKEDTD